MPDLLITNGRVIDPSQDLDRKTNLFIRDGKIAAYDVAEEGQCPILDASEQIVSPGLIDLNVQLREPGHEEDETILTGAAAARAGGYTTIACLANTEPAIDSPAGVEFIKHQAALADQCNVLVVAAVSKNREGKELSEMGTLARAGAAAFSDAPNSIGNPDLLRRALQYSLMLDKPLFVHPEAEELSHGGVMHAGDVSLVLALSAMPAEAEDVMTARDICLAESTGGQLHFINLSSAGSVEILRRAKGRGISVTAAVTPHHLVLTDEALRTFDPNCKINPPLRSAEHVESLIAGLSDGTIDVISSGHAPRAAEKKMREIDYAPYGMVGLETTLGLVVKSLIEPGHLSWSNAIKKMSCNPAKILGIEKGTLQIGADADITLIHPETEWVVDPHQFESKSANTPLAGWKLRGRATATILGGTIKQS